jgi:hypothetical protein
VRAPFISSVGGTAILVDELAPNTIYTIDTSLPSGSWTTIAAQGAPANRIAQRFLSWGSTMFSFGGYDIQAQINFNDLYAISQTALVAGQQNVPWIQVSPNAVANVVPDYPPARVGYTWTSFTIGAIMMGGLSLNNPDGSPAPGDPFTCIRSNPPPAGCFWHSHVWAFLPGTGNAKTAQGVPATAWLRLGQNAARGGAVPAGRIEHCAGNMGDQLYIYGGVTATGPVNDLWAYNLVAQTWAQVAPSSPSPSGRTGTFWSTGVVLGHSFYVFETAPADPTTGARGAGTLWRWQPSAGGGDAPAAAGGVSSAVVAGHTAGITLTVMMCLATLYIAVLLAQNAGVALVPSCGGALPSFGGGGGAAKTSASGFYSSSTAPAAHDGYVAPPSGAL